MESESGSREAGNQRPTLNIQRLTLKAEGSQKTEERRQRTEDGRGGCPQPPSVHYKIFVLFRLTFVGLAVWNRSIYPELIGDPQLKCLGKVSSGIYLPTLGHWAKKNCPAFAGQLEGEKIETGSDLLGAARSQTETEET